MFNQQKHHINLTSGGGRRNGYRKDQERGHHISHSNNDDTSGSVKQPLTGRDTIKFDTFGFLSVCPPVTNYSVAIHVISEIIYTMIAL